MLCRIKAVQYAWRLDPGMPQFLLVFLSSTRRGTLGQSVSIHHDSRPSRTCTSRHAPASKIRPNPTSQGKRKRVCVTPPSLLGLPSLNLKPHAASEHLGTNVKRTTIRMLVSRLRPHLSNSFSLMLTPWRALIAHGLRVVHALPTPHNCAAMPWHASQSLLALPASHSTSALGP